MTDKVRSGPPLIAVVSVVKDDKSVLDKVVSKDFTVAVDPNDSSQQLLSIACKYYTADVVVKCTSDGEEAKTAEAVIIYFDGQESASWQEAVDWMKLSKTWAIPLRLLVCSAIREQRALGDQRFNTTVLRTALDLEFELVELNPSEDTVEPDDEYGAVRVKSIIEAHVWPNMKSLEPVVPAYESKRGGNETVATGESSSSQPISRTANAAGRKETRSPGDVDCHQPPSEDVECETEFEKAFASLMDIREQVTRCTDNRRRRRLAEKLTVKFWQAIGGPEDEIEGLMSSSGDEDVEAEKSLPMASRVISG